MYQTKQSNTVYCIGTDNEFRLPHLSLGILIKFEAMIIFCANILGSG